MASTPVPAAATAAAAAPVAPAQIRVSASDECTLTAILRSAGVQIVGFIAKDSASLIQPALAPLCLAKKSAAPHLQKSDVTDADARRVGLVMRKEMKEYDKDVVIRQTARVFDAVGSNLGAEISYAEQKCPRSFRVLRTVGAALQTFDRQSTAPEPIVLRGTASATSETAAHDSRAFAHRQGRQADAQIRTAPTSTGSLPKISKRMLRAYTAFGVLANTVNHQAYNPFQMENANALFKDLTRESWRFLNTIGIVPSEGVQQVCAPGRVPLCRQHCVGARGDRNNRDRRQRVWLQDRVPDEKVWVCQGRADVRRVLFLSRSRRKPVLQRPRLFH